MSDEIILREMTLADYPAVKAFIGEQFYKHEPLNMSVGLEPSLNEFETDSDKTQLAMIAEGLSSIALQREKVVGVAIAGCQTLADMEEFERVGNIMGESLNGRIRKLITTVERQANIHERYQVERVLDLFIICVDSAIRGKGIGMRLTRRSLEIGREKGYPLIGSLCTSNYSARLFEKMGMTCCYELFYKEYKDETGKVVFEPPAPHTSVRVMVMKLGGVFIHN